MAPGATWALSAQDASSPDVVPAAVVEWFEGPGTSRLAAGIKGEIAERLNPGGLELSVSRPVAQYVLLPPTFDLITQSAQGGAEPADVLGHSGEYCARAFFGGEPGDVLQCASVSSDDTVTETGAIAITVSDTLAWEDIGALLTVGSGLYSLSASHEHATALDGRAGYDVGTDVTVAVADLALALAKQNAEAELIAIWQGEFAGRPSIMGLDMGAATAWRADVATALESLAADSPSTRTPPAPASPATSGSPRTWVLVGASALGLAFVAIVVLGVRRSRASAQLGGPANG